jgi:hypothetical protein
MAGDWLSPFRSAVLAEDKSSLPLVILLHAVSTLAICCTITFSAGDRKAGGGTRTFTRTKWLPRSLVRGSLMPLPGSRTSSPDCVPGRRDTHSPPSTVCTNTRVPRMASWKDMLADDSICSPRRSKRGSGLEFVEGATGGLIPRYVKDFNCCMQPCPFNTPKRGFLTLVALFEPVTIAYCLVSECHKF